MSRISQGPVSKNAWPDSAYKGRHPGAKMEIPSTVSPAFFHLGVASRAEVVPAVDQCNNARAAGLKSASICRSRKPGRLGGEIMKYLLSLTVIVALVLANSHSACAQ